MTLTPLWSHLRLITPATLSTALVAFVFSTTAPFALIIASTAKGGLNEAHIASWVFGGFLVNGIISIGFSLYYRQPLIFLWTMPGTVLVGQALAHRLVTLHKGTIEIVSDGPGTGSEFIVILPLMASVAIAPHAGSNTDGRSDSHAETGGMRVLVVDDNPDHALMLSLNLGQRGYRVRSAATGPEGLRIAQLWRPAVVLLDIGLPGLSGYEVARRLRSEPVDTSGPTMRIIALSGYGRKEDVALAKESGFDAHLVKPVDFEQVLRAIDAPTAPV
jgi:CheY-like chemotaxis protein